MQTNSHCPLELAASFLGLFGQVSYESFRTVAVADLTVSTPESALGFSTVLLGSPNPRRAFCEFGRAEFLWHASGHLAEL